MKKERIATLDFLRGIAVLLMVQQHTGYWFWKSGGSMSALLPKYPVMVTVNGLGALAAPLFIGLAGAGAAMSYHSGRSGREMFFRGIMLMMSGYLLNFLTPAWFAPWSWYVLHLIGFSICISPVLKKISSPLLLFFALLIIVFTVLLLNHYSMPRYYSNSFMREACGLAAMLKVAAFKGNFPIFPWFALFMLGFVSGRWVTGHMYNRILKAALVILAAALLLFAMKSAELPFVNYSPVRRLFIVNLYMFPAYPVQFMTLSAVTLLSIYLALRASARLTVSGSNIVVLLGRASLTVFMLHIIIIRNFMVASGLWQSFSTVTTVLLQLAVIGFITLLVYFWRKADFKYGFEWLLRLVK